MFQDDQMHGLFMYGFTTSGFVDVYHSLTCSCSSPLYDESHRLAFADYYEKTLADWAGYYASYNINIQHFIEHDWSCQVTQISFLCMMYQIWRSSVIKVLLQINILWRTINAHCHHYMLIVFPP